MTNKHLQLEFLIRDKSLPGLKSFLKKHKLNNLDKADALFVSTIYNNIPVLKHLLSLGANPADYGSAAFRNAVHLGRLEQARILLENGADIHAEEDDAIISSVEVEDIKMLELLVSFGADPHMNNDYLFRICSPDIGSWLVRQPWKR
jgi:ankyrin repeat protein